MNIPQASKIQSAIKIDCIFSEIINMDNLMRINLNQVNNNDLQLMIEKAQVLYQQIRNAKNKFFIFRESNHTIDLFVKKLKNKIKIINNLCNIFSITIYFN
jgi:esterase/lipase